jgi:hypothetical protein
VKAARKPCVIVVSDERRRERLTFPRSNLSTCTREKGRWPLEFKLVAARLTSRCLSCMCELLAIQSGHLRRSYRQHGVNGFASAALPRACAEWFSETNRRAMNRSTLARVAIECPRINGVNEFGRMLLPRACAYCFWRSGSQKRSRSS